MAQSRGERPLKNVAEAFEPLANSLNSHNSVLKVGPFVHASSFVVPLISVLDTTWKFAERDFAQKVNHLAANSDPTKTIEEIIVEDIQANNEREASSNTRYILKVKRGLDMLRVILEQIVAAEFPRLCVDFTNLNKACSKDDYPLTKIDKLVDSIAGHALFSFMDVNAGYHQIPLAEKDQPHTTFITNQGVYCYNDMSFGATYQRLVNKVFEKQIGKKY